MQCCTKPSPLEMRDENAFDETSSLNAGQTPCDMHCLNRTYWCILTIIDAYWCIYWCILMLHVCWLDYTSLMPNKWSTHHMQVDLRFALCLVQIAFVVSKKCQELWIDCIMIQQFCQYYWNTQYFLKYSTVIQYSTGIQYSSGIQSPTGIKDLMELFPFLFVEHWVQSSVISPVLLSTRKDQSTRNSNMQLASYDSILHISWIVMLV